MDQNIDHLQRQLGESAFHKWLGVTLESVDDGKIRIRLPFREEFLGTEEGTNIHGGIISTLADITCFFAVLMKTGNDAPTLNLYVDYLRMAPPNTDLVGTGKAVKLGRTICVSEVAIHTPDGKLIATGRSTLMNNAPPREDITGRANQ